MKIQIRCRKFPNGMFEIFPVGRDKIYVRGHDKIVIKFNIAAYKSAPHMKRFAERFWK